MIYQKFSKRQNLTLTWWNREQFKHCEGILCDGSVRSGKTVSMSVGFLLWSMSRFNGYKFAICGKTIASLRRNVITMLPSLVEGLMITLLSSIAKHSSQKIPCQGAGKCAQHD